MIDAPRPPSRTLAIAATGTALVMAVFTAFVVTVGDSVRSFHAGVGGEDLPGIATLGASPRHLSNPATDG